MIKIQPISVWTAEGTKSLDLFKSTIVFDNLQNSMTLFYELGYELPVEGKEGEFMEYYIQNGNLVIDGEEYEKLGENNINDEIILLSLQKLNLKKA